MCRSRFRGQRTAARLLVLLASLAAAPTSAQKPAPRSLMISLDSIPYSVVAGLTEGVDGRPVYFSDFHPPVPLISTFPSSTSVAMGGILGPLGLEKSPGYEARFFDWDRRKARGGGLFSYFKVEFPWRTYFDWGRKGPAGSAIEAVRPIRSGIKRLNRAIDAFLDSDEDAYLIYIAATDTAAHILDPEALETLLIALDSMLREAREKSADRPFEVVVFSDHGIAGGEPLINTFKPIKRMLKKGGFRVVKTLAGPNDVVLTPFGLVSSFEAYSEPKIAPAVAQTLTGVAGVDLCAYRDVEESVIWARDRSGLASFESRYQGGELQWRYRPQDSDPIEYRSLVERLRPDGDAGSEWVADRDLLRLSADARYPDALYRLKTAFELVLNPATVVCSLESGYMFGAPRTAALARVGKGRLRWTHGALEREASLGFLMSDASDWEPPPVSRFDEGLLPFVEAFARRSIDE